MTVWVTRNEHNPRHLDLHHTYGPAEVTWTEDIGHLRSYHSELGKMLDQAEAGWPGTTPETPGEPAGQPYTEEPGGLADTPGGDLTGEQPVGF